MRAKANNYTGAGMEERYTASNDRGSKKDSDNTKLRNVCLLAILSDRDLNAAAKAHHQLLQVGSGSSSLVGWLVFAVQSPRVMCRYGATQLINTKFSGLRHIMYHHPWKSTFTGMSEAISAVLSLKPQQKTLLSRK